MNVSSKIRLGLLAAFAAAMLVSAPASAQRPAAQQPAKPNILFIMGDDIGWMQPSCYHRGLMVGRDAQHRPHRAGRRHVHALLRRVELHRRACCVHHRHASVPRGHGPAAVAGRHFVSAPGHAVHCQVPARPRLQHRRVRQEPPRRSSGFAADGARVPGVLGLPLSPGRDAAGELPGHQQQPDQAGRRAADEDGPDSRHSPTSRARSTPRTASAWRLRGRSCG